MDIGKYIKMLRKEKGLTINQLALYSKVSSAHISRIERGLRKPSPEILKRFSQALKIPYTELLAIAGYIYSEKDEIPHHILNVNENMHHDEYTKNSTEIISIKISDNSMNKNKIDIGDTVIIKKQKTIENNEIAAVEVDNKILIRRIFKYENFVVLIPCSSNPIYTPILIDTNKQELKIIGKVIEIRTKNI